MALDELSSDARAILSAYATADDPSADDRARIDAKFERALGACGIVIPLAQAVSTSQVAATATTGAMRTGRSLLAPKLLGPLFGAGLVAAGLAYELRRAPAPPDAPPRPTPQLQATAAPKAQTSTPEAAESPGPVAAAAPAPAMPLAPVVVLKSASPSAPQTNPESRATPANRARPSGNDSLDSEVGLLRSATEAVRLSRYDRAMRLLELHASRYPGGALREERAGLRVLALCGLGKTALALEERERFLRASPRSVLAERVRGACSAAERGSPKAAPP